MIGKEKCRILKEIRQKIADENDIAYVTRECTYQGECRGTCPKCESELKYLEKQLAVRAAAGKRVAIAALCAGMAFSATGCSSPFESIVNDISSLSDITGFLANIENENAGGGSTAGGGKTTGGRTTGGGSETIGDFDE